MGERKTLSLYPSGGCGAQKAVVPAEMSQIQWIQQATCPQANLDPEPDSMMEIPLMRIGKARAKATPIPP